MKTTPLFESDKIPDYGVWPRKFITVEEAKEIWPPADEAKTHDIKLRVARNLDSRLPVEERAKAWLAKHPDIYTEFTRFAWQAVAAGCKRISADMVAHQVRWYGMIERKGKGFIVNNDAVSLMAKRFIAENPQCEGLFEFRGKHA